MTRSHHGSDGLRIVVNHALAVVASWGVACTISADTYTWDANGNVPADGVFSDPLNWNPDGLPTSDDTVNINGSSTVIIDVNAGVASAWTNYGHITLQGAGGELIVKNTLGCYAGSITLRDLEISSDSLVFSGLQLPQVDVINSFATFTEILLGIEEIDIGSPNTLVVRDGSTLIADEIAVGTEGIGQLLIQSGGSVTSNLNASIASGTGSEGYVQVIDDGSEWIAPHQVSVSGSSFQGGKGQLTVGSGGYFEVDSLYIYAPYSGGWLHILDGGIVQADTVELVNDYGSGFAQEANTLLRANQLIGFDGGLDDTQIFGGDLYLGHTGGSSSSTNTLDSGITWQIEGFTAIGYDKSSMFTVNDGTITSDRAWVARDAGSDGSRVTLLGPTTTWTCSDVFVVGSSANGALEIVAGAALESLSGHAGYHATSASSVLVEGGGSSWTCPVFLTLGREGTATVEVRQGGLLHCGMGRLGFGETGSVTMTVTDVGSSFLCDDWLDVGGEGTAALTITDAATLTAPEVNIGHEAMSNGTLVLENQASMTAAESVHVGGDADAAGGSGALSVGADCMLMVNDTIRVWDNGSLQQTGGLLVADAIDLRHDAGAAFIQGADGDLWVNVLLGFTGSQTFGGDLHLGHSAGASTSQNTLELGTVWQLDGDLWLGHEKPSSLTISDATLHGAHTWVGNESGADGSSVTISGSVASWENSNVFVVGSNGNASLEISDGGSLSSYNGHVSYHESSVSSTTVKGENSTWSSATYLTIGRAGTATVLVQGGGAIECAKGRLGWAETGQAGMTVTGEASRFVCTDWLDVGTNGTAVLTITDGGELLTPEINLGHESGDGSLTIADGGACHVSGSIYIAGDADGDGDSTASFLISDDSAAGTNVVVDETIVVYYPGSITLAGGFLTAQTIDTYYDGYKSFTGGVLHVETFIGALENEGCVLAPGSSIGVTDVHGDYSQTAGALEIEIGSATSHDQLACHDGAISLQGGDLVVKLVDGYVPSPVDSFAIATTDSQVYGTFDNAASQVDVIGGGTFDVTYNSDSIVLSNYDYPDPPYCLIARSAAFYLNGLVNAGDRFGAAVDIHGDVVLIGSPSFDCNGWGFEPGALFWFSAVDFSEVNDFCGLPATDEHLGTAVSLDDSTILVGAPDGAGGRPWALGYSGTDWDYQVILNAGNTQIGDDYGAALRVLDDVAIVGAPGRGSTDAGQAYAWRYDGEDWQLEQEIIASDWQADDNFASAIALAPDVVAIAVPGDSDQLAWRGSVYMFRYDGGTWLEEQVVVASSLSTLDLFGVDVALNADGNLLAVGVLQDPDGPNVTGQVVIFHHDGVSWVEEAVLAASDSTANDRFGGAVALEGDYLLVGARTADTATTSAGAVYVFKRLGVGNWEQQGVFVAESAATDDEFGAAVALDAGRAVIGAPERVESLPGGAVYFFPGVDDCNGNGQLDICDIDTGFSSDDNGNGIPDECEETPGDIDGDGDVDQADLGTLLAAYGAILGDPNWNPDADLDGDGTVGQADLGLLLSNYGAGG